SAVPDLHHAALHSGRSLEPEQASRLGRDLRGLDDRFGGHLCDRLLPDRTPLRLLPRGKHRLGTLWTAVGADPLASPARTARMACAHRVPQVRQAPRGHARCVRALRCAACFADRGWDGSFRGGCRCTLRSAGGTLMLVDARRFKAGRHNATNTSAVPLGTSFGMRQTYCDLLPKLVKHAWESDCRS